MEKQLTGKALQNVHKLAFLINEYPTHKISDVANLVQLSALDVNVAIWRAQDMGLLTIDDEGKPTIHDIPKEWQLGPEVEELKQTIVYALRRMARDETDIEENILGHWTAQYPTHDVVIAIKSLINERVIIDYEITTEATMPVSKKAKARGKKPEIVKDTYTFYTLWENNEQRWGEKQFKDKTRLK